MTLEKDKILESWIMVEHLSEGDINVKDKSLLMFENSNEQDFHTLFLNKMYEAFANKKNKPEDFGIVVYFDIFDFKEVVNILREKYHFQPTNEDIRIGSKFSLALYFSKNLEFLSDMVFFTESAYIRYYKEVPHEKDFRDYEEKLKQYLNQIFDASSSNRDKFNEGILKILSQYNISLKNCRMQILKNVSTDATNLHSFFIDDLENAKSVSTENLNLYLFGYNNQRVNLDSKNDSENFNPSVFGDILKPLNYPSGRFPSNTKFALSLMQQVAVNLATGYDDMQIRSVNGPPGTGKTTLLKDIFAELVVQQAYDIVRLNDRTIKGTEETVYYKNASIGEIPTNIAENNIVVASSNNGAVQNIVNELPLAGSIDENLIESLKKADYFYELSNSTVSLKWEKDEDGKNTARPDIRPKQGEEEFWGLFSLEGGKSDNMTNIITNIRHIVNYLEKYEPDFGIYDVFKKQYSELEKMREQVQKYSENRLLLAKQSDLYTAELRNRETTFNRDLQDINSSIEGYTSELYNSEKLLSLKVNEKESIMKDIDQLTLSQSIFSSEKPGIFSSKTIKQEYQHRMNEITDQLINARNEYNHCRMQEADLRAKINELNNLLADCNRKQQEILRNFENWKLSEQRNISELISSLKELESSSGGSAEPLDMNQDYDKLQLSNPWFNEAYRIEQSKLFITALRVRKQFLYENRKNVKAASIIWSMQNKYLDNKRIIAAAWAWINLTIPVISSTFASFNRMCRNLEPETLGHLFIDEAGQALPQASVGAIFRSKHVMVVGDPSQIKPVLTLDSGVLSVLSKHFGVTEKYLSDSASTQTLVDSASRYGFYREREMSDDSWIGIPLWVHRRCEYPMFTISNEISYNGLMVQGQPKFGKTGWFDVRGKANNKYVEEQGDFLLKKIGEMIEENPKIADPKEKDMIYVITPFANVAYMLAQKLRAIKFTRYDDHGRATNIGTIHTFQGKEAPIVFMVLGADDQSSGAARWAVSEPNMMNVAATRAKKEFYVIGDLKLYLGLGCDVALETYRIIIQYGQEYPELVDNDVNAVIHAQKELADMTEKNTTDINQGIITQTQNITPTVSETVKQYKPNEVVSITVENRITGTVSFVGRGKSNFYAYINGSDGHKYTVNEKIYAETNNANEFILEGNMVSFVPVRRGNTFYADKIMQG